MTIQFAKRALSQLASLHGYLKQRNSLAADDVSVSIATTIARLKYLPMLGVVTDEPNVRVLIESKYLYRVFYRINGSVVQVLSILHRAQK